MKTLREYIDLIDTAQTPALDEAIVGGVNTLASIVDRNKNFAKTQQVAPVTQPAKPAGWLKPTGRPDDDSEEMGDDTSDDEQMGDDTSDDEQIDEIDRRGFLKAMGAGAALAGAGSLGANTAFAQNMPDINKQKLDLANKYYAALVQRAKEDGLPLDTRTTNMLKAKAEEMAQRNIQQAQSNSAFSGSQSSETQRSKMYNQFEEAAAPDAVRRIEQLVQYK